jgi:hypothetical protein
MAFEIWGGYLAYGIGFAMAAAFLIAYRKDIAGRSAAKISRVRDEHKHAAEAA